jgi:hypothetical protein
MFHNAIRCVKSVCGLSALLTWFPERRYPQPTVMLRVYSVECWITVKDVEGGGLWFVKCHLGIH